MVSLADKSQPPKQHLDRFSHFCTAFPCAQHTVRQTTLRATSVAVDRVYAKLAMRPNNNIEVILIVVVSVTLP